MAPAVEVVNAFTEVPCGTCKARMRFEALVQSFFLLGRGVMRHGVAASNVPCVMYRFTPFTCTSIVVQYL